MIGAERLDVQSILGLARLVLDRLWAVGLLLIVFCVSALQASSRGMAISSTVTEWANAGALLGFASIVASIVHLRHASIDRKKDAARSGRKALANVGSLDESELLMLANVASLDESELLILHWLLKGTQRRFELHDQAPAYALLRKGVLLCVQDLGISSLCKLHP